MENSESHNSNVGLFRRLAAMIYDCTLIMAIWMVVGFLVLSAFGINEARTLEGEQVVLDPLFRWVLFSSMVISAFSFFSWFWTHSGQTLGMQAWKVKVQNADGSTISLSQCLIRFLIAPFSFAFLGLGYFWMFFDENKQTFHDKISKSMIVKVSL